MKIKHIVRVDLIRWNKFQKITERSQLCSRIALIPIMGGLIAIENAKKISLVHFRYSLKKSINTQPSSSLFFLVRTKPSSTLYTKRAVRLTRNFFENPYPVEKFVTTFLPGMGQLIFHVPITRPRFCFRQKWDVLLSQRPRLLEKGLLLPEALMDLSSSSVIVSSLQFVTSFCQMKCKTVCFSC